MADISSRASMVQVWLSLPSQWTMDAVRFLNIFYQGGETYGISKRCWSREPPKAGPWSIYPCKRPKSC